MRLLKYTIIFAGLFLFFGCNKYPDGPKFTILSRTTRMAGEWDLIQTNHSNGTITYNNDSYTLNLTKDGDADAYIGNVTVYGTWEFMSKDEKLKLIFGNSSYTYRILRLKEKELWLQDESTGDVDRYENVD